MERALERRPRAVMLSFGDPQPFIPAIRRAGAALILQVTDLGEARQALDAGADVIVAQGARGAPWPSRYPARTLRHPFLDAWRGREAELAADEDARRAYQHAVDAGEIPPLPVWASEAVDLITEIRPAAQVVADLVAQAEAALRRYQP